jgi:hypothetical protein
MQNGGTRSSSESGKPFINQEISTLATPSDRVNDNTLTLRTIGKTKSSIVANLVNSEDKLLFVSYALETSQTSKE